MDWILKDTGFFSDNIDHFGNKYLIGNGYAGVRGTLDEYTADCRPSINLAGVYDHSPGKQWSESVNAPNPFYTFVRVDGKAYRLPECDAAEHTQQLDIRRGLHSRRTVFNLGDGTLTVESERFASMADPHLFMARYSVSCSRAAKIEILSGIDADIWDINGPHFPSVELSKDTERIVASGTTIEHSIRVSVTEEQESAPQTDYLTVCEDKKILRCYIIDAEENKVYSIDKKAFIHTDKDGEISVPDRLPDYCVAREQHIAAWEKIWDASTVTIEGDDEAMLALNYSLYHLNSIAPRHTNSLSIPARGLSGQVYKGAIFWDTEMFMFDYFLFTDPSVARTFVNYRIDTLPGALAKAASYGYDGAFYAWESHDGGVDACSDYNIIDVFTGRPSRTYFRDKQVHVSAAMVYALNRYIAVTGDRDILKNGGAEMVIECAKFYRSLLLQRVGKARYEIHDVVGPDEYHERINNNAYTNRMAKFCFEKAVEFLNVLRENGEADALAEKYDIDALTEAFSDAAKNIFVPAPDPKTHLVEQFDGYFSLEDVSVETLKGRLIDEREYWGGANGVASHTQVNKQADTVALLGMFPEEYSRETMEANFRYYEPRTEHGSSLSACMYSLLACYIGRPDDAYPLFMKSAQQDLNKGSKLWLGALFIGGTHPAAAGGSWMVAARGFAGIKVENGTLTADKPALPSRWNSLSFKLIFRDKLYLVKADREKVTLEEIEND